jgi:hypothetical protein
MEDPVADDDERQHGEKHNHIDESSALEIVLRLPSRRRVQAMKLEFSRSILRQLTSPQSRIGAALSYWVISTYIRPWGSFYLASNAAPPSPARAERARGRDASGGSGPLSIFGQQDITLLVHSEARRALPGHSIGDRHAPPRQTFVPHAPLRRLPCRPWPPMTVSWSSGCRSPNRRRARPPEPLRRSPKGDTAAGSLRCC